MPHAMRPGDVLAGRYRLTVLLHERSGGRFWRAFDQILARDVALHLIAEDDPRADELRDAARRSATIHDPHLLRVLDTDTVDGHCFVVNEWGEGISLNNLIAESPLGPRRAAWITAEAGQMIATAHEAGLAHGRLVPENVLIDQTGSVKIIGFAVDAALHGLAPNRESVDVADLAGILYAALTGKWAGPSVSGLPDAPGDNGHSLRPRQVRAGVPRVLDTLCDEVLGSAPSGHGYTSARAIVDALLEYVGDPASVAAAEAALMRDQAQPRMPWVPPVVPTPSVPSSEDLPGEETVAMPVSDQRADQMADQPASQPEPATPEPATPEPATPGPAARGPETAANGGPGPVPAGPLPDEPGPPAGDDRPTGEQATAEPEETQAGVPAFDDGELDWPRPREEKPPPPPPFEDPPAKPLFAPDPPPGEPVRRPRHPQPADTGSGSYWPWGDDDTGSPAPPIAEEPEPRRPVPGRSWLRVAALIAVCLLIVLAMVYAFNRGRDGGGMLGGGDDDPTTSPEPATPVKIASASDFDPGPDGNGSENPESTGAVIDGDPSTTWSTLTYEQDMGEGGIKDGVGLMLDLGRSTDVRRVRVTLVGSPTTVRLYGSDTPPEDVTGLDVAAEGIADETTLELTSQDLKARYLLLWVTKMPQVEGGQFRAEVAEVEVRG